MRSQLYLVKLRSPNYQIKTMTDQQILTGAIELLSNKGVERRVQRLESQNLRLLSAMRKVLQIVNEFDCEADISYLIQELEDCIADFPLELS